MDEMEYSSLAPKKRGSHDGGSSLVGGGGVESITSKSSQQHSKSAVGAAAMAVEYGVGMEYYIGNVVDDENDHQNDDADQQEVDHENEQKEVDEVDDDENEPLQTLTKRAENYASKTLEDDSVAMRKKNSMENKKEGGASSANNATTSSSKKKEMSTNSQIKQKEANKATTKTDVSSTDRLSKSCNDLNDLEMLGQTVQAVNSALSGSTTVSVGNSKHLINSPTGSVVSSTTTGDIEQQQSSLVYRIVNVKFHRYGCVWDATLEVVLCSDDGDDNERRVAAHCVSDEVTIMQG